MNGEGVKILIVDDEEPVQKVLRRVLRRGGYEDVSTACSKDEALRFIERSPVDLVLTDMQMPGGSGFELLGQVRAGWPDVATLMVTAVDDADLADQVLTLGAYGYIIKPFKNTEVLINVKNALRRRHLEMENLKYRDHLEETVRARTAELWDAIRKLEVAEKDVRTSRSDTIERLAIAAEFRDEETGRHVARMSRYCELLARAADVDPELCDSIREASSLHDVGKIGIPDSILLKPTSLTPEERRIMQQHASIGNQILAGSDSPLIGLAASIALSHHEKYDGTGYPNGTAGDEIPLPARIAAIADVFDALTTNRVYRRAFPVGVAAEMMKAESGSHFDPELLDVFWSVMPDVLEVMDENASEGLAEKARKSLQPLEWEELR